MTRIKKFLIIVGARPNFIKVAPLLQEIAIHQNIKPVLVHTGQHYDYKMSQIFFQELAIPRPNYNLDVGSASHAAQTAKIMLTLEPIMLKEKPDLVIVIGDVNSTLAGALTAAKLQIPVAHIEAGLRSFDRTMPEEINRCLTDQISDFLFVTEPSGVKNLLKEGIPKNKIYFVGNILIDALKNAKRKAKSEKTRNAHLRRSFGGQAKILNQLKLKPKSYAVLTLHRPNNTDSPETLKKLLKIFIIIQKKMPIIFPMHPRTRQIYQRLLQHRPNKLSNLKIIEPLGYLNFIDLISQAKFVLTDSGGLQEETTYLKIPCLTLRANTERPITVTQGTNTLCGHNKNKILKTVSQIMTGKCKPGRILRFWDGQTAHRIITILDKKLYA